jgi:hypothetical protein
VGEVSGEEMEGLRGDGASGSVPFPAGATDEDGEER